MEYIYSNTDTKGKTNWIHITYTDGYYGYFELNVNLARFGFTTEVEIYLARYIFGGILPITICKTKLQNTDIFQFIDKNPITDNNVRDIVLSIFKKLKQYLQIDSCYDAVYYFPL